MRLSKLLFSAAMGVFLTATLAGCPGQVTNTFEVWLINDSDEFTITSALLTNDSDESEAMQLIDDSGVPVNVVRIVSDADAEMFEGSTATLTVEGQSASKGGPTVQVQIDETIQPGDMFPIVVKGNSQLNYDGEFLPLEDETKLRKLVEQLSR